MVKFDSFQQYVEIGGQVFLYTFHFSSTVGYFSKFKATHREQVREIKTSREEVELVFPGNDEFRNLGQAEFWCLLQETAGALLAYDCCIFHAAAFIWKGKAWLFTAPSGTGKSTQYRNWKKKYGKEVEILNGDKPVLSLQKDGSILVCPSPWRGKERYGSFRTAPLGGIVYLEQGNENRISFLHSSESIPILFSAFWGRPEDEDKILKMSRITEALVQRYPVWKLVNTGDTTSVELAKIAFEGWMAEDGNKRSEL